MKIQEQKWHDFTRLLILIEENTGIHDLIGTIQVELYPESQDDYGTTAYIYGLRIEESWRRKGMASYLMDRAEEEIRKRGHKKATLQWKLDDTPHCIFDWYVRRGYDDKEFGEGCALMVKDL